MQQFSFFQQPLSCKNFPSSNNLCQATTFLATNSLCHATTFLATNNLCHATSCFNKFAHHGKNDKYDTKIPLVIKSYNVTSL